MGVTGRGYDEACFEVKSSNITNAGQGLFTRVSIPGNHKIIEAKGTVKRDEDVKNFRYCFDLGEGMCLEITNAARKANDAHGTSKHNNSRWYMTKDKDGNVHVWLVSNRPIAAGAEILVDYGKGYWTTTPDEIRKASRVAVGAFTSKAFTEYQESKDEEEEGEEQDVPYEVKQILEYKKIGQRQLKEGIKALKKKRKTDTEYADLISAKKTRFLEKLESRKAVAAQ